MQRKWDLHSHLHTIVFFMAKGHLALTVAPGRRGNTFQSVLILFISRIGFCGNFCKVTVMPLDHVDATSTLVQIIAWRRQATWWRHQMETFSALLAICAGNSPVKSPHKGQWRGALKFSLICVGINGWVNNREAGDLRRDRAYYNAIVMNITLANIDRVLCHHM